MENETAAPEGAESFAAAEPVGLFEQLLFYLQDGGPVLYLLVAVSLLALTVILAKIYQFTLLRPGSQRFVGPAMELWQDGRPREALDLLRGRRSPVARVLETALYGVARDGIPEEVVKEEVSRVAGRQLDNLRSGLRLLALIASLSPLIGLLGTVLGMIRAFQALEAAGNRVDPSILSGGIWIALLTTAAGLIIAIPAAAAHNWMEGVVQRSRRAMEDAATRVFTSKPGQPGTGGARSEPSGPRLGAPQPAE